MIWTSLCTPEKVPEYCCIPAKSTPFCFTGPYTLEAFRVFWVRHYRKKTARISSSQFYETDRLRQTGRFSRSRNQSNGQKFSLSKSIVRTANLKKFRLHMYTGKSITSCIKHNDLYFYNDQKKSSMIDENILNNSFLHLNHYVIQSLDWFMRIKSSIGSNCITTNNVRNIEYSEF